MISRYLNGYNALNRGMVLLFAKKLGIQPGDIYPELFSSLTVQVITDDEFFKIWSQLTEPQKKGLKLKAATLARKNKKIGII